MPDPEKEGGAAEVGDFDPATYDSEDFDEMVGRYALDVAPDFILTFSREEGKFYAQATGQSRLEIVPTSDSTFALSMVEASVTFQRAVVSTFMYFLSFVGISLGKPSQVKILLSTNLTS